MNHSERNERVDDISRTIITKLEEYCSNPTIDNGDCDAKKPHRCNYNKCMFGSRVDGCTWAALSLPCPAEWDNYSFDGYGCYYEGSQE